MVFASLKIFVNALTDGQERIVPHLFVAQSLQIGWYALGLKNLDVYLGGGDQTVQFPYAFKTASMVHFAQLLTHAHANTGGLTPIVLRLFAFKRAEMAEIAQHLTHVLAQRNGKGKTVEALSVTRLALMVGNVSPQTLAVARMTGRHSTVQNQCARKVHSLPIHQT